MFNLEKSIDKWLKQFKKHQAFDHGSLREMELHLRDHVDDLLAKGYSEKSAFEEAVKEFGEVPSMAEEEFSNHQPSRSLVSTLAFSMYSNYFKVAFRSFTKQPFFTFLNTFGLAIGMAGGLLISLFIYDELNYDTMFPDADRVYRLNIDNQTNGEYSEYATSPSPMAAVLLADCPQVEKLTRFRLVENVLVRRPETQLNVKENHVTGADTMVFEMFGLKLMHGNSKTALKEPNTMVMTVSSAVKHFGVENALGQSLLLNDEDLYMVTGIVEDMPKNSFLRNHTVFLSLSSFEDAESLAWNTWRFPTFVKLKPQTKLEDFQAFLDTVKDRYLIPWAMTFVPGLTVESSKEAEKVSGNFMRFNTTALTDIHLHSSDRRGEFSPNSDIQNVYIMTFIGFFLILLACVNFMNLSTAYSLKRSKEVGIRKTLGSNRFGLVRQFLTESSLISLLSLILAVFIALIALPYFNVLADKSIEIPYLNIGFWVILLLSGLVLGLLSGGYPAFFLSRFVPVKVLKGHSGNTGGGGIRNSLVVFQFAISVFLIVSTLVVYQQVNYIQNKELGFQKDQVLVIDNLRAMGNQTQAFKEGVQQLSQVSNVSLSSYLPTPSKRGSITYFIEGAMDGESFSSESAMIIEQWDIDQDYIPTLDLEVIAGRNFDREYGSDSSGLILNEATVTMLGTTPEEAIGMRLTTDIHRPDKENMEYLTVIGVVKNFHYETLRNDIDALTFILNGGADKMIVRLGNDDFSKSINDIEEYWNKLVPGQPLDYYFMNESFNDTYKAELRLGNIFMVFTFLSLFIASLGLFGLAAFNAEKRIKEIGIKKVLGASARYITFQLSLDFLKLVAIAIIVALPISWYAMNRWLDDFSYRIDVGWEVFAISAFLAIVISILTVSYQSIKAAMVNPVKNLRSE